MNIMNKKPVNIRLTEEELQYHRFMRTLSKSLEMIGISNNYTSSLELKEQCKKYYKLSEENPEKSITYLNELIQIVRRLYILRN